MLELYYSLVLPFVGVGLLPSPPFDGVGLGNTFGGGSVLNASSPVSYAITSPPLFSLFVASLFSFSWFLLNGCFLIENF